MAGLTPTEKAMIQEMYHDFKELKPVVFGSDKLGVPGLIKDVAQNKKDIQQYKSDRVVVISLSGILATIGAYLAKLVSHG